MNDVYLFGVVSGTPLPDKETLDTCHKIAQKHDASCYYCDNEADGRQFWFSTRNYGSPHDENTAEMVITDIEDYFRCDLRELWHYREIDRSRYVRSDRFYDADNRTEDGHFF